MATTVKKDGIRQKRLPQSSKKHALSTPYDLTWPPLDQGVNGNIIKEMIKTFEPLSFHELLTRRVKHEERLSGGEGIATRKDVDVERAKKLEKRSCLVIGTNEVVRALEKGTLKLLLVNRSVKLGPLFEHILILSATRKTPACAVSGMDERIPTLLGVSRVAAFGFKMTEKETPFDALVEFIKSIIPPLFVSWLHPWKDNESVKNGRIYAGVKKDVQTNSPEKEGRSVQLQETQLQDESLKGHFQGFNKGTNAGSEKQKKRKLGITGNARLKGGVEVPPAKKTLPLTDVREIFSFGRSPLRGAINGQEDTEGIFAQGCSDAPGKMETNLATKKKRRRRKTGKWIDLMEKKKTKATMKKHQKTLSDVKLVYLRPSIKSVDTDKKQTQAGKQ